MRYFLRRRIPFPSRILLIESGSRRLIEGLIPYLRDLFGPDVDRSTVRAARDHATVLDQDERSVFRHRRRALQHGEERAIHRDCHRYVRDRLTAPGQGRRRSNSRFLRKRSKVAGSQFDAHIA